MRASHECLLGSAAVTEVKIVQVVLIPHVTKAAVAAGLLLRRGTLAAGTKEQLSFDSWIGWALPAKVRKSEYRSSHFHRYVQIAVLSPIFARK